MNELSEEARALLAREAPLDEPTPAELEAGRQQVFAALGIPLPPTIVIPPDGAVTSIGAKSFGAASFGLPAKLAAVSLLLGASIAGVVAVTAPTTPTHVSAPSTAVPSAPAQAPSAAVTSTPVPEPVPVPEEIAVAEEIPAARPHTPGTEAPSHSAAEARRDALATESMLVAAAEAQLRAGHASGALSLFDRYLAEHPDGALRHESLAGRIAALCRLGRLDAGRAELERFATRFPRSPSLPRLRTSCGVEP